MNELSITVILLLIISASATFLSYIVYIEYKKIQHLKYVKAVISLKEEDMSTILEREEKKERKKDIFFKIETMIKHAGFNVSVTVFLVVFLIFSIATGSLFALFLKHYIGYFIGIPFGAIIYAMVIKSIISKRKKEFNSALATSISVLVKMMKNGVGFEQALFKSVSVSSSSMFKNIFATFFQEKNAIGEEEAFSNLHDFVRSKELLIFALAIQIGRESGGQFSNTLEKVEKTITYRKKMQEKVDVVTREGAVGSYIVVAISFFLYFILNGNFDGRLHDYFMNSEYGRFQLLGIAGWVFLGMLVNKFITGIDK